MDESEDTIEELEEYFRETVLPLARVPLKLQSPGSNHESPLGSPLHVGMSPISSSHRKLSVDEKNNKVTVTDTMTTNPLHGEEPAVPKDGTASVSKRNLADISDLV
jgi:hypothetical protein